MITSISIIVPIYHGKRYLDSIIRQIEGNKMQCSDIEVELLLVNDAPDDPITENYHSEHIDIRIFNTEINRGIHGARVEGLRNARGEFVLFLDQDDRIMPDYIRSQCAAIGRADAVVCRCLNGGKSFYTETFKFEKAISKEYTLMNGCPIISPGQVLIRKISIPDIWKENIMTSNCADDYFLWIVMMAQNKTFALNQNIQFEHIVDGQNLSMDINRMYDSEQEMLEILMKTKALDEKELLLIQAATQKNYRDRIARLIEFKKKFLILDQWVQWREEGYSVGDYFADKGIRRPAIYGRGDLGIRLRGELKALNIQVDFFIDRNAEFLFDDIPIYTLEKAPEDVDAVILSLIDHYEEPMRLLQGKYGCKIYTIRDVMEDMGKR